MKKLSSILSATILVMLIGFVEFTFADTYVQGYVRKDGTYVQPHYRSTPDNSRVNNWSSKCNVNTYTGQQGYRNPYVEQPRQQPRRNFFGSKRY